jgi:hypothetical protein
MKLKATIFIACMMTIACHTFGQNENDLMLNSYVLDTNAKYFNLMQSVTDRISEGHEPVADGEAENYDAISTGRWNWFWSNRLNTSGMNKGGFSNAYKALLQQMNSLARVSVIG